MSATGSLEALATSVDAMLNELIEQYAERLDAGETLDLEQCVHEHPEFAEQLRKLLPTMQVLAELGHSSDSQGASRISAAADGDAATGTLGDFRILREIGRGGMGVVYEAEQISLGRRVALKVLPFAATMDKRQLQRFVNEARAAASLEHPHIVPVYGVGCERGVHYYAMRFIEGHSLDTLLQCLRQPDAAVAEVPAPPERDTVRGKGSTLKSSKRGKVDYRRVAELALQAAEALEHAHQSGVVHRDVKPANLLLDEDGNLWITDFGLAQIQNDNTRLTMTGDLIGTLRYMSPEQALAKRVIVDQRTDVYSLGATFYEVLTLSPVFTGDNRQELLRQIAFEEPVTPRKINKNIPVELETVILKALEKNPADRYVTAKEMADDLKRFLNDEPTRARRPTLWQLGRKWARRHVAAVRATAVGVLATLVMAGVMAGWWMRDQAAREAETERAVNASLRDADQLQKERKMPEALAKVQQAQSILASGTCTPALAKGVRSRVADLKFVAELEDIRAERDFGRTEGGIDYARCDRQYAEAFQAFGIDVGAMSTEQAASIISEGTVAVELAAALDDWSYVVKQIKPVAEARWKRLLTVAMAVDPNAGRKAVREAIEKLDGEALTAMVDELPLQDLPPATLLTLAKALAGTGASQEALKLFQDAQKRYPTDFWIAHEMSRFLGSQKPPNQQEALRFATAAVVLRPGSAAAHVSLGNFLLTLKRYDDAIASYRDAIRVMPANAGAHHNIGNALSAKGQWDEAIAAYREALRIAPNLGIARINLGNALREKGLLDEAIAQYKHAIDIQGWDAGNYALAYNNFGLALAAKKQQDEAIAAYNEALRLKPGYVIAYNNLGNALLAKGKKDEAIAAFREAIALQSDWPHVHYHLGRALYEKGQWEEAIAEYQEEIRLHPDFARHHHALALALQRNKRNDEAILAWREALRLDPSNPSIRKGLAEVLMKQGQSEEAIALYRESIRLNPSDPSTRKVLADVLMKQGQSEEAIALYRESIRLNPSNPSIRKGLADVLMKQGQSEEAIALYRESVRLNPKSEFEHRQLASLLVSIPEQRLRDPQSALILAKTAVKLNSKISETWDVLGMAYYRNGEWQSAVDALNQGAKMRMEYAAISKAAFNSGDKMVFFLAMAHWQLGDKGQARAYYEKGVQWMTNNKLPAKLLDDVRRLQVEAAELLGINSANLTPRK